MEFRKSTYSGSGEKGDAITVYGKADLRRREKAAKKAGVRVNVRRIKD